MTTNPLPDLSKWHEVPANADIPANTPYAWYSESDGWGASHGLCGSRYVATARDAETRYFTREPIPAPRTPPPSTRGTILVDVALTDGTHWEMAVHGGGDDTCPWLLISDRDADANSWSNTDEIAAWGYSFNPLYEADPLDENDHRDRLDRNGDLLRREPCGAWHYHGPTKRHEGCDRKTLKYWATAHGPFRFADEATS